MRKGSGILQSCTVSTGVVPGALVETNITSSDEAHEVIRIKVEEDAEVHIKIEEIPEPISFPSIKTEPEEVSYLSVCSLLDTSPISIYV
jgi:hypothetical protein